MDWYKNWFGSPYYKILYENRDEFEAQEFVENLLGYLQPPPDSVMLDIACGEGRFARQLASHGYDVTGIDLSQDSIAVAKGSEADHLSFFVHDMRFPFYINYFDYAFNFFTSFGYFTHNRDHLLAAKSFAAGLKNDGIIVLDYFNAEQVLATLVPEENIRKGGYDFRIRRSFRQNHIIKEISICGDNGAPQLFTESVAAFSLADFIRMFRVANLSLVTAFGDYKLNSFHPLDSPRLVMVFKKRYGA